MNPDNTIREKKEENVPNVEKLYDIYKIEKPKNPVPAGFQYNFITKPNEPKLLKDD